VSPVSADFYVIARERGAENPSIPTWANRSPNPALLDDGPAERVIRQDIAEVPGAFLLLNLLNADECARLVALTEALGYLEDAAVSLPRAIRHNHSTTWVTDDATTDLLWRRCHNCFHRDDDIAGIFADKKAVGLNARFRFYRYAEGDYFATHTDGSWPGSRVIDGELVHNAYDDRWSQLSFLLFLSADFVGGATRFYVDPDNPMQPARDPHSASSFDVRTPLGGALCFPHGVHPLHCLHASEPISAGVKYIIRTDVLFEL
jgi:hypothetical protein